MIVYFVSIIVLFLVDRFTKLYILQKPSVVDGFLSLSINKNIAFSLPLIDILFYPLIILIILILFFYWFGSFRQKSILIWPWSLVIIGAISNLLDRINYGGVIDFILVPYFTVFNLSDLYISVGVVWLLIYYINHKD